MSLVKRTRREALKLTKELWTEIRDKGLTNKWRASIWKRVKTDIYECQARFTCEYDETHTLTYCLTGGRCILANIWPEGCVEGDSPYITWSYVSTDKERYKAADAIVEGCDEALAALDKKAGKL